MKVVVDTDILVDHLRGVEKAENFLKKIEAGELEGFFSTITEAELFSGRKMDSKAEQQKVSTLLEIMKRVDVNSEIAREAGEIRRKFNALLPDALIAATAISKNAKIATKNIKHYEFIEGITLEIPY